MKKNKITKNNLVDTNPEMSKLVKVVIIVIAFFALFLGITYFITKKNNTSDSSKTVTIQYEEIMAGQILNRSNSEYYVLATTEKDNYNDLYTAYVTQYKNVTDHLTVYTVNLNNGLNNSYVSENSNFNVQTVNDIKFKESTLLKIKDGKISEYYEGKDNIVNYLSSIIK